MEKQTILVTGATGTVGSEVVRHLVADHQDVRVLVRDPAKVASLGSSVEIKQADLLRPDTLGQAFGGAHKVFVVAPPTPDLMTIEANAFEAARDAGANHIVYLSNFGAGRFGPPIWDWHGTSEARLKAAGLDWTILRPARFMTDTPFRFSWMGIKERGVLAEPTADGEVTMIDPSDIGAVAAKILTTQGHEGEVYELSAAEGLTGEEIALKIGAALAKPVSFVNIAPEEARALMLGMGIPDFIADTILRYCETVREGQWYTTGAVEAILGRSPRTFDAWLSEHGIGAARD
jgi:uncharacterized protein YbjT (DUF2867 family)